VKGSKTTGDSEGYGEIHHPASASDHAAKNSEQQPEEQCVGGKLPYEYVHEHHGQDNDHQNRSDDVNRPPST
jgi:hypothetical protein